MNGHNTEYVLKVVVVGDSHVGKTTMLQNYIGTQDIGRNRNLAEKVMHRDGKKVKLQIYDTMGQERFRSMTTSYYRGTRGCILCYDVTNANTFENISCWVDDIQACISDDVPKILAGIYRKRRHKHSSGDSIDVKNDVIDDNSLPLAVSTADVESLANRFQMTSTTVDITDKDCIEEVFGTLADMIIADIKRKHTERARDSDLIVLYNRQKSCDKKKSSCAC